MHICQDEIIAVSSFLGLVPYTGRWVWYRFRCLIRSRKEQKLLPPARVVVRHKH